MATRTSAEIEHRLERAREEIRSLLAQVDEQQRKADTARTPAEAAAQKRMARALLRHARTKLARMKRLVRDLE